MKLVERNMSKAMDVPRLIDEIHKRPPLWDVAHGFHRTRFCVPTLWQEVANNVGVDVLQCKRKWKNLRDAYRAEYKRSQRRIENDKLLGTYNPNNKYGSKWIYYSSLSFLTDDKPNTTSCSLQSENDNSNSNDNNHYMNAADDSIHSEGFVSNIKYEVNLDINDDGLNLVDDGDDDVANETLFKEFQSIATPAAARRLSATLSKTNLLEKQATAQPINVKSSNSTAHNCKCAPRADDQIHFLEDLGREEQKLMISTRQDIKHSNKFDHIGDSDYNFLVSFLPNMKKMTELQNLQFRANMCDMILNILKPTVTAENTIPDALTEHSSNQAAAKQEKLTFLNSENLN